ncbi:MAG TPA: tonB-system energizer ExbB [Aliidongia sp.]|nr:tonB-system energizer ExbB [Aliidongia sp.]
MILSATDRRWLPVLAALALPTPASAFAQSAAAGSIGTLPHDLSPWNMFLGANLVVKAVLIGLALASVATWTIWLAKSVELRSMRGKARQVLAQLRKAESLREALGEISIDHPAAELARIAAEENAVSGPLPPDGIKERVAARMQRIEAAAGRHMLRGTGLLATIGATAPFVGLFGTVWGIMNSFIGISKAQTTNLAVVAPGIAEALLATAIGLVAAIPAVIIYNMFARAIADYKAILADASTETMVLLSRDLDRRDRHFAKAAE